MDSILDSIKKMCGISKDDTSFDPDMIININSIFMILNQLGVGPKTGYSIKNSEPVWGDYVQDVNMSEAIQTFIYLKVRLLFDPPANAAMIDILSNTAKEYEWRILMLAEEQTTLP